MSSRKLEEDYGKWGLTINIDKTQYLFLILDDLNKITCMNYKFPAT